MKKNIIFVFPYHGVGGVSLLFLRLAEYIAENFTVSVSVVDYRDGYIAKNLTSQKVDLIAYFDDQATHIPENSHLIFQSITPWSIYPSLVIPDLTKIFYWNCHPYNLVPVLPICRSYLLKHPALMQLSNNTILFPYKKKIKRLLALMQEKKSIVFMDGANVDTTKKYIDSKLSFIRFLPIPVSSSTELQQKSANGSPLSSFHIAWVGRVVDFKYHILYRALERIDAASKNIPVDIKVTIVGDGDYLSELKAKTAFFKHIQVAYIDHLNTAELDQFLIDEVDVLIGMGTSALEGAKLAIPTVLLDFAYKPVAKSYNFSWLKDQKCYNLGSEISHNQLASDNASMQRLLEILMRPNSIGRETHLYYLQNHTIAAVAEKLLGYLEDSICTYRDLKVNSLLSRGILYSVFVKIRGLIN